MSTTARSLEILHVHPPSVHVRFDGGAGYDYEMDLYFHGGNTDVVEKLERFAVIEGGREKAAIVTFDSLVPEDVMRWLPLLPMLLEGGAEAMKFVEQLASAEFDRQVRISNGAENRCMSCGCSESRACSGGCAWAKPKLCTRCAIADFKEALVADIAKVVS